MIRSTIGHVVRNQFFGANPNSPAILLSAPPSVPNIPYFHTMDVPTIGAIQGIKRIVRNMVFIHLDGRTEMIWARNRVMIILPVTAATQNTTVFLTASQNTSSWIRRT